MSDQAPKSFGNHDDLNQRRKGGRPTPLNDFIRDQMRSMPRSGTALERSLRSELFRRGLRFRVNYRELPGTPDIAFTRAKIAVFVDGCFWHGCPLHCRMPKNNREWWQSKIARNKERDDEKDAMLEELGWVALHYWEHDDVEEIADEVEWVWRDCIRMPNRE